MVAQLIERARKAGLDQLEEGEQPLTDEQLAMAFVGYWMAGGGPEDAPDPDQGCGPTITGLARWLGVSRAMLYSWVTGTEERKRALTLARKDSASTMADEALHILDTAGSLDSSRANSRAQLRKWLASVYDRATFGQQPAGPVVAISVGSMHLQAHEALKSLSTYQPAVLGSGQAVVPAPQNDAGEELAQVLGYE
jgi:hypothetical protein